jgi:DNA-binding CsgD family transcriptional regulator
MAGRDLREVAERLSRAADVADLGNILGDACERAVPFGIFNYAVFGPGVSEKPCMVLRSEQFPIDWGLPRFPPMLLAIERDLGGIAAVLGVRRAFDAYVRFPVETIKDTEVLNEHWRPVGSDQQLAAPIWHGGSPVGYFAVSRTRREIRFMEDDLRVIDELRVLAERGLGGVAALGTDGLSATIDVLSRAFPYPAFLFDFAGRLQWMSDEGAVRLGVAAAKLGGARLIRGNASLEALARHAAAIAGNPATDADGGLRRAGVLKGSERLAVRCFGENGASLVLLAFTPALAGLAGEAGGRAVVSLPRMGAAESRVARLAAEGYTVLNIATQLGVTEATVRTHLRRVYVKLGVHGRAELTFALLKVRHE